MSAGHTGTAELGAVASTLSGDRRALDTRRHWFQAPARRQSSAALVICLVGLVALAADLGLVTLAVIIWLIGWQVPAASLVRQLSLAVLAFAGITASLLTILAQLGLRTDLRYLAGGVLVVAAVVGAVHRSAVRVRFASPADWWATGTAALAFAVFYRPFAGASPGRVMAQLSYSTDPANHLGLVQRTVEQSGYLTASDYPPAWAGNVAVVIDLVVGGSVDPARLLGAAAPIIVACYALLVFFAVSLALDTLHSLASGTSRLASAVATGSIALAVFAGPGVLLVLTGSYTQMTAMTALLAATSLLQSNREGWPSSILLGLLGVAVMQTWYLLTPVLAGVVLLYVARFRPPARRIVVVAVPVAMLSAYPLLNAPPPVQQINTTGAVPLPPLFALIGLLLLSLLAVVVLLRSASSGYHGPTGLATLLVTALGTMTCVMALQTTTGGALAGYYSAKLFYAVAFFTAVGAGCAAGIGVLRLRDADHRSLAAAVSVATIAALLSATAVATRTSTWPVVAGQAAPGVRSAILDRILLQHPKGLAKGTDAWIAEGCRPLADHISSKWTHDLFDTWDEDRQDVNNRTRTGNFAVLAERARSDKVKRMEIYVETNCRAADVQLLAENQKVTVHRVG